MESGELDLSRTVPTLTKALKRYEFIAISIKKQTPKVGEKTVHVVFKYLSGSLL
jgi:hypothetical protein